MEMFFACMIFILLLYFALCLYYAIADVVYMKYLIQMGLNLQGFSCIM